MRKMIFENGKIDVFKLEKILTLLTKYNNLRYWGRYMVLVESLLVRFLAL